MHELGVVFHVIDQVEAIAKENHVARVAAVTLELGEVSTVLPDLLTDCWNWAVKKTDLLKTAELHIETLPAVTWCDGCKREYPTVAHGRICPYCGSEDTWLLRGNEFIIQQIEVE